MWSLENYKEKAQQFAKEYWGLDFNIPIYINPRMIGHKMAHFVHTKDNVPLYIEISKNTLVKYTDEDVISTLKHELCHWALCVLNKPFYDGDPYFESEIERIGSNSTGTKEFIGEQHYAACSICHKICITRSRSSLLNGYINGRTTRRGTKVKKIKYSSNCCKAPLYYKGSNVVGQKAVDESKIEAANLTKEQIEAAKAMLTPGKQVYILGRNVGGKVILAGRRMVVWSIEGNNVIGSLVNDKKGNIQKSHITMPIECLDLKL